MHRCCLHMYELWRSLDDTNTFGKQFCACQFTQFQRHGKELTRWAGWLWRFLGTTCHFFNDIADITWNEMKWHDMTYNIITYYAILNGLKTYDIHSNRQIKSNKHKARHHRLWALRRQCLFWNFLCSSWPFLGVVCVAWLMLILVSAWKRCSDGTTACAGAGSGPRTAVFGPFEPAETRKTRKTISQHGIPIPPSGPFTSQMQFFAAISGCAVGVPGFRFAPLIHKDVGPPSENANSRSNAPGTETRCLAA